MAIKAEKIALAIKRQFKCILFWMIKLTVNDIGIFTVKDNSAIINKSLFISS